MEKRSRAAYMREYRRRKQLGLPTIRAQAQATNHAACDAEIEKLKRANHNLRNEIEELRKLLPW